MNTGILPTPQVHHPHDVGYLGGTRLSIQGLFRML